MHTVELLERLKDVAEQAGYTVRLEWLGGVGGGACEFAGRKWIFIDLALSVVEQVEQVQAALAADPAVQFVRTSPTVRHCLAERRAA
jgi:hypothetical protein